MLFLPYKAETELHNVPILTIGICILCIGVFIAQVNSWNKAEKAVDNFCSTNKDHIFQIILSDTLEKSSYFDCEELFFSFLEQDSGTSNERLEEIVENSEQLAGFSKLDSKDYVRSVMQEKLWTFERLNLKDVTSQFLYYPDSYSIKTMFTSSVAHGDTAHLLGNLFIFFVFAATVELAIGFVRFVSLLCALAIGTGFAYSWTSMGVSHPLPTLGLSGIVMGMIGTFVYLFPKIKIKCFFWFLVFIRFFSVPAWILALWFVGWDIYGVLSDANISNINFVAHLSGAFIGFAFGVLFLRKTKREYSEI